jgi:hypothetical protein
VSSPLTSPPSRALVMLPMPPLSPFRRPRAVPRALLTRRYRRRLRSPAATPPTRRSTGCSVAQSRSKSLRFCENAAACARFFAVRHTIKRLHDSPTLSWPVCCHRPGGQFCECRAPKLFGRSSDDSAVAVVERLTLAARTVIRGNRWNRPGINTSRR